MNETFSVNLKEAKQDVLNGIVECNKRCLTQCGRWLAELNHGLTEQKVDRRDNESFEAQHSGIADDEFDDYILAKSYFDVREYDRSAYFTRNCESPVPKFLHMYATYMSKEKKRLDNMTDSSVVSTVKHVKDFADLLITLRTEHGDGKLDGYCLYLYGVILKKLDLTSMAVRVLVEAINAVPTLWSAWVELAPLITHKGMLNDLELPNHWIKHLFIGYAFIELFLNDEGIRIFQHLLKIGFSKCIFIPTQLAIAFSNKRDVDRSIEIFQHLQKIDPFRLDNLDSYSNLLFVKDMKTEMSHLAHKVVEINKYSPETCCVVGNYYSIRSDHYKAVMYFQRALKLNPRYLSAWTLMGHEFMEMKNTNAAIQSYRQAVEVNRRDFRAWYGLGQAYEILKMPYYSLFYYKAAQQLRPYDSRMLVALGETYEKLDKVSDALKCYQKAYSVGDIEGVALFSLAKLYEKQGEMEKAVVEYLNFCREEKVVADKSSLCHAYMTLANFYEKRDEFDKATHFAYKCLDYEDTKREAESLLKSIANKRGQKAATSGATTSAAAKPTADEKPVDSESTDTYGEDMDMDETNVENTMLRSGNTTTILCEEQTKFILDRIGAVEKHFSELCGAFSEYTRKVARLRDKSDELAHATQDYCDAEKYNRTLANALSSLAKAVTLISDFQDTKVKRLETKIVAELSQYESVCKHCKEGVKEALLVRDKDLARRKQLEQSKNRNGRFKRNTNDTEIIKSNLEVEKSLKEIEQIVERFEKQKLHDIKDLLRSFVLTELKMHTQAMEVLSATYQDINEIDECKDHQRIKSQSMGALNATFAGFAGGRKNKSLSSNSLNSSQEQEQEQDSLPVVEQQRSQRHTASRRSNKTSVQQSVESLV
uniref:Cyclosome subunit 8 n=1 Tax=Anopheles atroparvus TaxID=41427 RepID=A0A182J1T8_ANOAO